MRQHLSLRQSSRIQERTHSGRVRDAPQGFRRDALDCVGRIAQQLHDLCDDLAITVQRYRMQRRLPHACLLVGQRRADCRARLVGLNASQSPHRVAPHVSRQAVHQGILECADRFVCGEGSQCPPLHGRARVVEQSDQRTRSGRLPIERLPQRILGRDRAFLANAVDGTEQVGLGQLRRWTTELVPSSCIDHQQAAVGVLHHVGWMEIAALRHQEVRVFGLERRAMRHKPVG